MFSDKNKQFHIWTYPSLLYYHVDHIRLVDLNAPDSVLETATHTVWVRDQNGTKDMVVSLLQSKGRRDQVLAEFRKYELQVIFDPTSAQKWIDSRQNAGSR